MSKIHLYGKDYDVFEKETLAPVEEGALISSPAKAFVLQTRDRKEATVGFIGTGGELYVLPVIAMRASDDLAEHLKAQLIVVEAGKK